VKAKETRFHFQSQLVDESKQAKFNLIKNAIPQDVIFLREKDKDTSRPSDVKKEKNANLAAAKGLP
jgi:hypothetical protein